MKPQPKLTPEAKTGKARGFKALRVQRRKAYYGARPSFTLANKRRTLARQLRRFPEDNQARELFRAAYGVGAMDAQLAKITGKAWKRAKRRGNTKGRT
jgi:hypothetical protein